MSKSFDELKEFEFEYGIKEKVMLEGEEEVRCRELLEKGETLPGDIFETGYNTFYRIKDSGMTDSEVEKLIMFRQERSINTIKKCIIAFVVLNLAGLIYLIIS